MYVFYTVETLGNRQAAKAILADARDTTVIVDGMFHELQDYEGMLTDELHLQ